jgi:type I restriction enzyme R subunit
LEIKKFKNEEYPKFAVTVDLMTTGIDVPEICNLVFMRRVKSRILYEQMIGRATRKCDEIEKDHFKIFDCVKLYDTLKDYSSMNYIVKRPKETFTGLTEKLLENPNSFENIRDEIVAKLQRKRVHVKKSDKLQTLFKATSNDVAFDEYIEKVKNIASLEELVKEVETIKALDELKLNTTEFFISEEADKFVATKRGYGKEKAKPQDYMESFKEFLNNSDIEAIKVYKTDPKKFKRKDLIQIKAVLDYKGYTEIDLKSAYKALTNEDITANIFVFIKNAIKDLPIVGSGNDSCKKQPSDTKYFFKL